ncbi:MAG: hypothetical protein M3014_06400 [Chloroflexota bacterium]|nr:hypothetical protein [Chloroflexota bacterium]
MSQKMMWDIIAGIYRGQATDTTVVTVEEAAMTLALTKAGKGVFDADWWPETLTRILEHWGIYSRRWIDEATRLPRMHFVLGQPKPGTPGIENASGPLSARIMSGPLNRDKK